MRIRKRPLFAAAAITLVAASSALAGSFADGGEGVGDSYFPTMGNTGYDALTYDFKLRYQRSGRVRSKTVLQASADTSDLQPAPGTPLASFHLDFRGPEVTLVKVNGAEAGVERNGQELVITPATPIPNASTFSVVVRYRGRPKQVSNPDGTRDGWTDTSDGVVALGEPQAVPTFAPVSDHPTDKASWTIELDVPRGLTGTSNGELFSSERTEERTVTTWEQAEPMASYLLMVAIGEFRAQRGTIAGIDYYGAVDRAFSEDQLRDLKRNTREAHDFLASVAGEYPFAAIGGVVDPSSLRFALENQSRPYYPSPPGISLVVHELAHQWFGDSVSVNRWKEIWLNEGFATYMEWLYEEDTGGRTAAQRLQSLHASASAGNPYWDTPPADPGGPSKLFAGPVYDRGAAALQVLRATIGNGDFDEVLSRWATENEGGNVDTSDLYALIADVTGDDVPQVFDEWLYSTDRPALP